MLHASNTLANRSSRASFHSQLNQNYKMPNFHGNREAAAVRWLRELKKTPWARLAPLPVTFDLVLKLLNCLYFQRLNSALWCLFPWKRLTVAGMCSIQVMIERCVLPLPLININNTCSEPCDGGSLLVSLMLSHQQKLNRSSADVAEPLTSRKRGGASRHITPLAR